MPRSTALQQMYVIRAVLYLLMLAFSESAFTQTWIGLVLSIDKTEVLADVDSIKPIMGDRVAIWTYNRNGPPKTLKDGRVRYSYKHRYFADCSRNQIGTAEAIWYGAEGNVLNRYLWPRPEMEPAIPESNGESIFLFACDAAHRKSQTEWYESIGAPKVKAPE